MSSNALHIVSPSPRSYHYASFVQPKNTSPLIKTERLDSQSFVIDAIGELASNHHAQTSIGSVAAAVMTPSPTSNGGAGVREEVATTILGSTFYSCRLDSSVLERYQQLFKKETLLVQQLGTCDSSSASVKNLGNDLLSVLNQKMVEIKALVGREVTIPQQLSPPNTPSPPPLTASVNSSSVFKPTTPPKSIVLLYVEEQPTGNVVANKYLEPPLVVRVDDSLLNLSRDGKLQVTASLCLTLSDEILSRTLDNKQDILQGHTQVPVSSEGYVTFNKLKIMEVSSKHHHQAFSIQLQLQEICTEPDGNITTYPLGESIKLAPLHVQSRINKRKRSSFNGHISKQRKRTRG